jgi:hypothetical protein
MDCHPNPVERIKIAVGDIRLYARLLKANSKFRDPERFALTELLLDLADWLEHGSTDTGREPAARHGTRENCT